jgi:hypothetical protein
MCGADLLVPACSVAPLPHWISMYVCMYVCMHVLSTHVCIIRMHECIIRIYVKYLHKNTHARAHTHNVQAGLY